MKNKMADVKRFLLEKIPLVTAAALMMGVSMLPGIIQEKREHLDPGCFYSCFLWIDPFYKYFGL